MFTQVVETSICVLKNALEVAIAGRSLRQVQGYFTLSGVVEEKPLAILQQLFRESEFVLHSCKVPQNGLIARGRAIREVMNRCNRTVSNCHFANFGSLARSDRSRD